MEGSYSAKFACFSERDIELCMHENCILVLPVEILTVWHTGPASLAAWHTTYRVSWYCNIWSISARVCSWYTRLCSSNVSTKRGTTLQINRVNLIQQNSISKQTRFVVQCGMASIKNLNSKVPSNILLHSPTKIDSYYSAFLCFKVCTKAVSLLLYSPHAWWHL